MGIDLFHKLESYSHTSEKKLFEFPSKNPFATHTDPIFNGLQILKFSGIYLL